MTDEQVPRQHEDTELFCAALNFTERDTAFRNAGRLTRETYAENFRASLTRRKPAIHDFYDIDHAVTTGRLPKPRFAKPRRAESVSSS